MNFNSLIRWRKTKISFSQKILHAIFIVSFLTLSGCGGGSSSTTSTENNLPSPVASEIDGDILVPEKTGQDPAPISELELLPVVSVSSRQFADPNVLLNLRGTVKAATGATIVKTLWTQVTGPLVSIPFPLKLENVILIPDVNIATQLEFRLTAQDSKGRINSATVSIFVKPVPAFVKVVGGVFNEADEKAIFMVHLNAPSSLPATISYVTQDGTANNETDYIYTYGTAVLNAGEVTKEISVPLLNDTIAEDDESFSLQITAIDGEATHANRGVAIIHNGSEPHLQQTIQFSNPEPVQIDINEQYTNSLIISNAPGTGDIIYSSSNPLVASINAAGTITGLSSGSTEITATKLADNIYLSASASFTVQVGSIGASPSVEFSQVSGNSVWPAFAGYASDEEDGSLPTQEQITESQTTNQPVTSVFWQSDIDGFLTYDSTLNTQTQTFTQGIHTITYFATDSDGNTGSASRRLLIGDIATITQTFDSSTCDDSSCDTTTLIKDANLDTIADPAESWISPNLIQSQWISLSWSIPFIINTVDLYTPTGYAIQDYDIEYFDGNNNWITLTSVINNTELHRSLPVANIITNQLRIVLHKGALIEPDYARINEIVVLGTEAAANPSPSSSSSSSTPIISSSVASSTTSTESSSASSVAASSSSSSANASSSTSSAASSFSSFSSEITVQ